MSILLEALRKSEKDQQEIEVAGINSDEQPGSGSKLTKPVLLTLLLVVVLAAGGWFIWHQYGSRDEGYQPPVTLTPDNDQLRGAANEPSRDGVASGTKTTASVKPKGKTAGGQRTPVETLRQAAMNESKSRARKAGESPAKPGTNSVTKPGIKPAANPAAKEATTPATRQGINTRRNQAAKAVTRAGTKQTSKPETQPANSPTNSQKELSPPQPEPISYWELPDSIRESLPEIKFSVLVYARRTVDRFVLIDGQRYGHWDKLPSGAILKEIRRDGVVFKYRKYEFIVEK